MACNTNHKTTTEKKIEREFNSLHLGIKNIILRDTVGINTIFNFFAYFQPLHLSMQIKIK